MPRQHYLDLTKLFAIFLVLWGHTVQFMGGGYFWTNPVFEFIYSFHMPLFMVISGYFFSSGLRYSLGEILKKKTVQLLLPIFSWVTVIALFVYCWHLIVDGYQQTISDVIKNWLLSLKGDLWFLKSLFSCYLLSYLSVKIVKKERYAFALANLLFLFIPSLYAESFLMPFFWMGIYLKRNNDEVEKHTESILLYSLLGYVMLYFFWTGKDTVYAAPIHPLLNWQTLELDFTNYGIAIYRWTIGAAGSISAILLFKQYTKENTWVRKMAGWGTQTMGIYILQYYLLQVWISNYDFPPMHPYLYNFVVTPLFALLLLIICLGGCKLLQKNKYTSLIFLGA